MNNLNRDSILFYIFPFFFFLVFFIMSVLKYLSLHTSFFDFGIFLGFFYKLGHYGKWWLLFKGHAQPLMAFYAVFYKLFPANLFPLVLFFFQSLFVSLPGLWIGRKYGILFLFLLFLYFPLWFNVLFDFHIDHLAIPLLFWFYLLVEERRYKLAFFPAALLALVKEPFALQTVFCGIFLLLHSVKEKKSLKLDNRSLNVPVIIGLLLVFFGFSYFSLLINYIFPFLTGKKGYLSLSAFSWLGSNIRDIIFFIFTHPFAILKEILGNHLKIFYLILIFGPFLFISLLSPLYLIPAIPILAISLLSRDPNHYGYAHHYTAGLIAPIFISFVKSLPKIKNFSDRILFLVILSSLCFHVLFSPSPISRLFWTNKVWNYGYEAYFPEKRDNMIKKAIKKYVPSDPEVPIATQNTLNFGYLAQRKFFFSFPLSVVEPAIVYSIDSSLWSIFCNLSKQIYSCCPLNINIKRIYAQYLLIDLKRPWYIMDKGCNWQTTKPFLFDKRKVEKLKIGQDLDFLKWAGCAEKVNIEWRTPSGSIYKGKLDYIFLNLLQEVTKTYKIVFEKDGFIIFKKLEN